MRFTGIFGLATFLFGLYLAFFTHSKIWDSFFVVGGFLFLEFVNSKRGNSILSDKKRFLTLFFAFFIAGIIIEIIGNLWLNMWKLPNLNKSEYIFHVLLVGYPFSCLFGLEFLTLFARFFRSKKARFIILPFGALIFGFINEYINTYAYEWKYNSLPLGEFLGIPIIILFLWLLLLLALPIKKFIFRLYK